MFCSILNLITFSTYKPVTSCIGTHFTLETCIGRLGDAFIELREGSITEVLNVAREKLWLRSYIKMPELMEQAVAATRWASEDCGSDASRTYTYYRRRRLILPCQQHVSTLLMFTISALCILL